MIKIYFHSLEIIMKKRPITDNDISYLFESFDTFFPNFLHEELRSKIIDQIKGNLIVQFKKKSIYPQTLPTLRKKLETYMKQCIIPAGEMVGVICAQSIGERQTQLTLNSFHQSGLAVNTVITGVPRFLEILNATKEPKITTNSFELHDKTISSIKDVKILIGHQLRYLTWKDLVINETFHMQKQDEPWYDSFEYFYGSNFRGIQYCFTYMIDKKKFFTNHLSFPYVRDLLEKKFKQIHVVFSPLYIGQVDIFIDTTDILQKEDIRTLSPSKQKFYLRMFFEEIIRPKIGETHICGIPKISDYFVQYQNKKLTVDTEGSNIQQLLKLPLIDPATVRTNHMWEVYELFGIEGTRKFLIEELKNIVSSDGTFINESHLMILADLMTNNGSIQSISRYGMKREQISVLTRSSFEESLEHFSKAAFFSERESIHSVSASIMCGKRSNVGTGAMSIMVDWDKL